MEPMEFAKRGFHSYHPAGQLNDPMSLLVGKLWVTNCTLTTRSLNNKDIYSSYFIRSRENPHVLKSIIFRRQVKPRKKVMPFLPVSLLSLAVKTVPRSLVAHCLSLTRE